MLARCQARCEPLHQGREIRQVGEQKTELAALAAQVQNDNLVRVFDVQERDGLHYLIMEFVRGVTLGRWAWGSNFVDLNNDGWEDILVTNGFITQEDTGDL